ncbi:translation initiation factor IF-2-like isoform X2 [Triticum urartu]|uniref:translation initiation factor IF-2-like isoform X2 n=1 Tax=Triticum urartu TaxID=4572 RepID=UPI00204436B7|nr:translation initiation factor IF-2-like isoform X2 [Triticum urartu]
MARGGARAVAPAALLLLLLLAAGGGVHCLRGGERRHGPGAAAPRQPRLRRQERQRGGGLRRPGLRRRQGLVAAAAHRQLRPDQVVGRGVQAGAGARHLRRQAADAQLRGHRGHRRRRGHGDRGHGQRAHLGAVQALRRLPRPAGAALRPVGVAVLRRRAVQLLLLRRAAGGHRDVRRPGVRPAGGLQLRAQLPRRVLLPRRAGARQAEPGRRGHRGLRVRLRHQQPGPVRGHVGADGARPEPALADIPDHGAVRRRVLLLPAAEGVRLVGLPRPRRRRLGVPQLHADRVHRDGHRPAAGALLHGQPDRDQRGRRGGAVPGLLGRRRRRREGHRGLGHDHHEPGAVGVRGGAGRVREAAGGVPAGAGLLHPGHLLRPDGAEGGAGAEPEAGVRRRRGGGGGLQGRAVRGRRRRLPGVPGPGRPRVRGRHPDHRQLPAEEPAGGLRHRRVPDRVRAGDL